MGNEGLGKARGAVCKWGREKGAREERGRSDVVSATAQNNNFHSSPLDTNRQMKETSEGVALLGGGNARRHPK